MKKTRVKKRKPGRPSLPTKQRRDKRAYANFTSEELKIIDAKADSVGLSRMAYLRWKVLGNK